MIIETIPQLAQLTRTEKIELALELWGEVDANAGLNDFPLTPEQDEELERRLRAADENPGAGVPMEEAFARIRSELRLTEKIPVGS